MSSKLSSLNTQSQTYIKTLTNKLTTNITVATKRLNYLTLSLALSLTSILPILLPATATAAPSTPPDSCFDFDSGIGTITSYYEYEGNNNSNPACTREVIIPNTIGGTAVTSIGNGAFEYNQLTSIAIPNSVTVIGDGAFQYNQLTSLTIPNSVTAIGNWAFGHNQLTSLAIPNSVTVIGDGAFQYNQLISLTIPNSVTAIGNWAFGHNQLTSLAIPNSVTAIGNWAFGHNQLTSVTIPNSVTTIGVGAFQYNQLTSVTIPNSVTTIGNGAFSNNQLTSITIPNSVTVIGEWAFSYNQLTSVTIPNSVITIGDGAFSNNRLTSIALGNSVTTIGTYAFMFNKITDLVIPNSVTAIGNLAFQTNSIAEVTIPDSVTSLSLNVFNAQIKPGGTDYLDFTVSGNDPQVAQAFLDSVIYTNINASLGQVSALGLADSASTEAAMGGDINADGDQTDIASGNLINPARVTATYKDNNGNTIAPSTTATGTGLTTYLAADNQNNDLSLYYKAGNSYTVPTAPSIAGYTITTTPSNIASLSAGDNQINYVYTANSNNNNGGGNSNTANLTTPTSPISNFSLKPVSLTTPTGTTINSSSTVPESSLVVQDNNNQYPLGLVNFSFTTNQSSNQVVLNFETDLKPNQVTPRKYNSNTNTYNNLPTSANPTITETTINNKHHLTLAYTLIDNGELDLDPTTGIIKDPVGLAVSNQTYNQLANTGSNNTLPIAIALSLVPIAGCLGILSKRRKSYRL